MKEGWKVIGRKMPPKTKEHIEKIRQSNIKTWSNPILKTKHSSNTKIALSKMSPELKEQQKEKINRYIKSLKHRELSRKTMIRLRENNEWLNNSKQKQKEIDKNGKNNPFWGKKHIVEVRLRVSKSKKESPNTPRGEKNPAYIDGKGKERKNERVIFMQTIEYRLFVEGILKRDKYTCKICKVKGVNFHVDHIKSYREYPELRTNIKNGRLLCIPCHRKTSNYGRKKDYAII